jgi:hypothetical protein
MRGSTLLPKSLRTLGATGQEAGPSWLNRKITSNLLSASQQACMHPIHIIVVIALLASTSYVGLLQQSLFESATQTGHARGHVDVDSMLAGGRTLELSRRTSWKWQSEEGFQPGQDRQVSTLYSAVLHQSSGYGLIFCIGLTAPGSGHICFPGLTVILLQFGSGPR